MQQIKPKISLPIIVEGKYDKNTLKQIFDATVVSVGGFSVFNSSEKQTLIRRIAKDGIIVLTDSDGGGKVIRSFLNGILPKEKIFNAYVPKIKGKEKRKTAPSKEGYLGVEGMDREELLRALAPFIDGEGRVEKNNEKSAEMITKVDLFVDGFTGASNSADRRSALARAFSLPEDLTANALLEALNIVADKSEYKKVAEDIKYSAENEK